MKQKAVIFEWFFRIISKTFSIGKTSRRIVLVSIDIIFLFICNLLSLNLTNNSSLNFNLFEYFWLVLFSIIIGIIIFTLTGQYKSITSYSGSKFYYLIILRNALYLIILSALKYLSKIDFPSQSYLFIYWFLICLTLAGFRLIFRDLRLLFFNIQISKKPRIAIYGAGAAGLQLANSLRYSSKYNLINFIDDNTYLSGRNSNGTPIFTFDEFNNQNINVDKILLAIPSMTKKRRKEIIDSIHRKGYAIYEVPTIDDITSGRLSIDSVKAISIEDLLGRQRSLPKSDILLPYIKNSSVCVTGAGGSIGAELARQLIELSPRKLILIDHSELNIYNIEKELKSNYQNKKIEIVAKLASVTDQKLINRIFIKEGVNLIFHAAAYKHVPIVEANPLIGIKNNVCSTFVVCSAAIACKANNVVLISSDKAVRPTNIMGATKRLSELIIQAFSEETNLQNSTDKNKNKTIFSMVRFGNVLNSSGSVVPLFRDQIKKGGPITITHRNIVRYFMTIDEAADLVLQSIVMAKGGEIFLLDMGKPISILKLAKQMIKNSGHTIQDTVNPKGDIKIKFTGLRPGEKLYEELLINSKSLKTDHPLIYKAVENALPAKELFKEYIALEKALEEKDEDSSLEILQRLVPEWSTDGNNIENN